MDNFDKVQIHYLERDLARVTAEADEMAALAERWEDRYCKMCIEVNAAEARTDALGIQLAAQGERLRLAMAVADAARDVLNEVLAAIDDDDGHDEPWFTCPRDALQDAMLALDRIPGDALPHGALASSGRLDALAGDNRPTCDDTGHWRPIDATKEKP
jgi:hypothetical protein